MSFVKKMKTIQIAVTQKYRNIKNKVRLLRVTALRLINESLRSRIMNMEKK